MRREIVITQRDFRQLREHLLRPGIHEDEQMAYILCGVNEGEDYLQLLVREVIPVPPEGFEHQSGVHLTVKKGFTRKVYQRCSESGLSLIEAHSHPFASGHVSFSSIDTANEEKRFPYVEEKIPNIHNASMVLGRNSIDAHVWDKKIHSVLPIDLIRVVGTPCTEWVFPTSAAHQSLARQIRESLFAFFKRPRKKRERGIFSRQILAFTRRGQELLSCCCVGIVGVGGIGSIVAEFLARLGVGSIVLVDHDVVEWPNLNRMLGTTPASVGRAKVEEVKEHLGRINPSVKVTPIPNSITDQKALSVLKSTDFLVGGVDNHGARLILNQLSVKYLIPLIDCGTQIWVEEGRIKEACGQVAVSIPGGFCLECIDRIDRQRAGQDLLPPHLKEREVRGGYVSGVEEPAPSVVSPNGTVASLAVTELINLVVGFKPIAHSIYYDVLRSKVEELRCQAVESCITCGKGGIFALGDLEPFPDFEQKKVPKAIPSLKEFSFGLESEEIGGDNKDPETREKTKS
jgi:molybdopterin/thiamine biosynthesis adenylyltransferase